MQPHALVPPASTGCELLDGELLSAARQARHHSGTKLTCLGAMPVLLPSMACRAAQACAMHAIIRFPGSSAATLLRLHLPN